MIGVRLIRSLLVAVIMAAVCSAKLGPLWHELEQQGYSFEQFKADFNKAYASVAEEAMHRAAFEENLAKIIAHNRDRTKTWRMGVNQMADRPRQALISSKHGYHKGEAILRRSSPANTASSSENLLRRPSKSLDRFTRMGADATQQLFPYEVDWRKQGVVTAVKNQGQCG